MAYFVLRMLLPLCYHGQMFLEVDLYNHITKSILFFAKNDYFVCWSIETHFIEELLNSDYYGDHYFLNGLLLPIYRCIK
jgi:hypothetical protein